MQDRNRVEIKPGTKCLIAGEVIEVYPGNAGNDRLKVRCDAPDPVTKQPTDLVVANTQIEQLAGE